MFSLYILQKFLSLLILLRLRSLYGLISLIIFFIIFFFKDASYDILAYIEEVGKNNNNYEFFYNKITNLINFFYNDKNLIIKIYQILLIFFVCPIIFLFKKDRILILSIILSSVAFMLAVHNNLRQGTALLFILFGILLYIKGYKKSGIFYTLISLGFHNSAIMFITAVVGLRFIFKLYIFRGYSKKKIEHIIFFYFYSFVVALMSTLLLFEIMELLKFKEYLNIDIANVNEERINHTTKIQILFFYTFLSEYFMKFRPVENDLDFLRFLRIFFLFFVVFISFLDSSYVEISNRILYFYYIIEIGILCLFVEKQMYISLVFIMLASAFAFNVWSIIG